jgi:hypothetical protein
VLLLRADTCQEVSDEHCPHRDDHGHDRGQDQPYLTGSLACQELLSIIRTPVTPRFVQR